jgi:hypothetical protein
MSAKLAKLGAVALACFCACTIAGTARAAEPVLTSAFLARFAPSLLKVETRNSDGTANIGTAVVVGNHVAATNCHVIAKAKAIGMGRAGARMQVTDVRIAAARDVCLLYAFEPLGVPVPLADTPPKIDAPVVALGFGGGSELRFSGGTVEALYDYEGGRVIRSSSAFVSGASGGALLDTEGRLLGLVTFKSHAGPAYHFSVPATWIAEELKAPKTPLPETGMAPAFWQGPADRQPFFLRAAQFEADRQWQQLAELGQRWTAAAANDSNAWLARGKAELELGRADAAVASLARAVKLDATNADAWYVLGRAYAALGKNGDAMDCYRRLMALSEERGVRLAKDAGLCGRDAGVRC